MATDGDLSAASNLSITRLTPAGWLLALACLAAIALVAVFVGAWALQTIPRKAIGAHVVICLLAIPAFLAGGAAWILGSKALRRLGVEVWRCPPDEA